MSKFFCKKICAVLLAVALMASVSCGQKCENQSSSSVSAASVLSEQSEETSYEPEISYMESDASSAAQPMSSQKASQIPAEILPSDAVVAVPVADIRNKPDTKSTLDTQALFNQRVEILARSGGFYQVKVADGYTGYTLVTNVTADMSSLNSAGETHRVIIDVPWCEFLDAPMGTELYAVKEGESGWNVRLPGGKRGVVMFYECFALLPDEPIPLGTVQGVIEIAKKFGGAPYLWGGTTKKGADCSGLTYIAFRLNGITLPRDSTPQSKTGTAVNYPTEPLMPGDQLFFSASTDKKGVSHTGIYMDNGEFIHSASGKNGLTVSRIDEEYYKNRLAGVRRRL